MGKWLGWWVECNLWFMNNSEGIGGFSLEENNLGKYDSFFWEVEWKVEIIFIGCYWIIDL